jgi:hypothetical protein
MNPVIGSSTSFRSASVPQSLGRSRSGVWKQQGTKLLRYYRVYKSNESRTFFSKNVCSREGFLMVNEQLDLAEQMIPSRCRISAGDRGRLVVGLPCLPPSECLVVTLLQLSQQCIKFPGQCLKTVDFSENQTVTIQNGISMRAPLPRVDTSQECYPSKSH